MENLLQELYKSEINFRISTFWDEGFKVEIGDEMNEFVAEFSSHDLSECMNWLQNKAVEIYPDSKFAKSLV